MTIEISGNIIFNCANGIKVDGLENPIVEYNYINVFETGISAKKTIRPKIRNNHIEKIEKIDNKLIEHIYRFRVQNGIKTLVPLRFLIS